MIISSAAVSLGYVRFFQNITSLSTQTASRLQKPKDVSPEKR
jgi:hypothetical protein